MVLTAYLDESGTHAGAKVSAMAGFVGNARQWRKYKKRTASLFKRYGVKVFHAIDVRRGHGDFKGWTVDRKIEFLDEFQHIINDTLESGVVSFIRDEDYKYYSGLHWPKKTRRDSKYTIMFRACLAQIVDVVGHIPHPKEPRLHVVLEDGHNNAEDAVRNYKWVQERVTARCRRSSCLRRLGRKGGPQTSRSGKESHQIRSLLSPQYVLVRFKPRQPR
ncbi:MAG: hypothetical protein ACLPKH_06725 [Rhodomicrobium sp.]